MNNKYINLKRIIFFSIILFIFFCVTLLITTKLYSNKGTFNTKKIQKDSTTYSYQIKDSQIMLYIDSNIIIDSIKTPENNYLYYKSKRATLNYPINKNGNYTFYVNFSNKKTKIVNINIETFTSKMNVYKESEYTKLSNYEYYKNLSLSKLNDISKNNLKLQNNTLNEEYSSIDFIQDNINITNENVLITLKSNTNNQYKLQYKIENGPWIYYTSPIEIKNNCTIYARLTNGVATTDEMSYMIKNIDKEEPKISVVDTSEKNIISYKINVVDNNLNTKNYYYFSTDSNLNNIPKTYSFQSGEEVSLSGTSGDFYLYILAIDEAGNKKLYKTDVKSINIIGPQITVDKDNVKGIKELDITPTITGVGPITIYYGLSHNRKTVEYTNTISSGEIIHINSITGNYFLHIKAIDSYGNETEYVSNLFYFDNEPPKITSHLIRSYGNKIILSIKAQDNYFKKLKYYYSIDGTNYQEGSSSYTFKNLNQETKYTIYVKVVDEIGNYIIEKYDAETTNNVCPHLKGDVFYFDYTGSSQSVLEKLDGVCPGKYKIELWGASGGYRSDKTQYAGRGGYASAIIELSLYDDLYIYVGQTGTTTTSFNGGGSRNTYTGGGGATDLRVYDSKQDWSNSKGLNTRILVAGGGGSVGAQNRAAGAGGGESGISATSGFGTGGGGASLTAGGSGSQTQSESKGLFGQGGKGYYRANGYGGAGGGGWYGGGGTYPDNSADDDKGGGGGSGFALISKYEYAIPSSYELKLTDYNLTDVSLIAGNKSMPSSTDINQTETGRFGNGRARITYIGE